ncbi:hypothetical protein [Steroidobacter sp.]|uniref:hypothetical protein n=1 Tax=Steroidobacter sp. TaxID=1978227 RepID=UPI001A5CD065|nr:hypothetical protein [Steroidobacter sp.]MBL8265588.1 hypothetical protein [Steroidobacter sp.]
MPRPESVRLLAEKSLDEVASWLARGFFDTARDSSEDPFAPHSFIHLAQHPAEGIEELYAVAPPELQRSLRAGVVMLGGYCCHESHEFAQLDAQQRRWLLSQFLRLTANLLCIRAATTLAKIACDDSRHWPEDVFREEVFPDCCVCLQTLGLAFARDAYAGIERKQEQALRLELAGALRRVVRKVDYFDSSFAPRTLAALLGTAPTEVIAHLELLSSHMNEMHRRQPEQKQLAHLTGERIVSVAFHALARDFYKLQIGAADARDTWLLDALFGAEGPLFYWWSDDSQSSIGVAQYADPEVELTFHSEGLRFAALPPETRRVVDAVVAAWPDLWKQYSDPKRPIDLHNWREQAVGHKYAS